MADLTALRERLRERAAELVDTAGGIIEDQLRAAAGDGLPPDALTRTTDGLSTTITAEAPGDITVWEWTHYHEPPNDFDPHVALDGISFSEADWREVLSKSPGEFPVGTAFWYPQDHGGCACEVAPLLGDKVFDPFTLDAEPVVVSAFGQDILVVPPATATVDEPPEWWSQTLTPEGWEQALRDAAAS